MLLSSLIFFSVNNLDYSEHIIKKNSTVHLNGTNEEKQGKIKIMQLQKPIEKCLTDYEFKLSSPIIHWVILKL